ncbi:jhamt [Trichonephila clavata]|uniref:Jhamt n=1 Tax=Trichonephila clavata TaxID=2740835 RepID=A0A8X6LF75_TRICU|nr:jhamt [Trichonephila clavata]
MSQQAYYCDSIRFVKRCIEKFHWKDLSEDVVMDIGCGDELNCCKAILKRFPNVRALIAVDKESTVFQTAKFRHRRIEFCVGDIEERFVDVLLVLIDSSVTTGRLAVYFNGYKFRDFFFLPNNLTQIL